VSPLLIETVLVGGRSVGGGARGGHVK